MSILAENVHLLHWRLNCLVLLVWLGVLVVCFLRVSGVFLEIAVDALTSNMFKHKLLGISQFLNRTPIIFSTSSSTWVQQISVTNFKWNWKEKKIKCLKYYATKAFNKNVSGIFCVFEYFAFLALATRSYAVQNCSKQFSVWKEKRLELLRCGAWFMVWIRSVEWYDGSRAAYHQAWHKVVDRWSRHFITQYVFPHCLNY